MYFCLDLPLGTLYSTHPSLLEFCLKNMCMRAREIVQQGLLNCATGSPKHIGTILEAPEQPLGGQSELTLQVLSPTPYTWSFTLSHWANWRE